MLNSGTSVKTTAEIITPNGCWIDKGTPAIVLGVASSSEPVTYLLETQEDDFEPEEFFCFEDHIELIEREVA